MLYSRLNSPSILRFSFCVRYFNSSVIFAAPHRTPLTLSISLYWRVQHWTQHYSCVPWGLSWEEGSLGLLLVLGFAVLGSFFWSTSTVSRSFSTKLNSSQLNLTCAGRWSYSSSSAGHHVSCCWMLWDSRVPISLPCWGRSLYAFWPFSA